MIRREPSPVKGGTTWTGFGFMQVYEGSDLTFDVPAIFRDLDYDLVVRHEHLPNFPDEWASAKAELVHLDGPPTGKCAKNATAEEEEGSGAMSADGEDTGDVNDRNDDDLIVVTDENGLKTYMSPPVPFSMSPDALYTTLTPKFCLEEGKRYQIKLTFDRQDLSTPNPKATILIDSVRKRVSKAFRDSSF